MLSVYTFCGNAYNLYIYICLDIYSLSTIDIYSDPPFEQAAKTDKWFKPLMAGKIEKFWKAHHKSPIANNNDAKDLLTRMLCFDPKARIDMNGIKNHPWFKGATLKNKELINEIRDRHRKAEKKRRLDVRKMNDLAQSLNPNKPIPGIEKAILKDFPKDLTEGLFGDYTFVETGQKWFDIYNLIEEAITGRGQGTAEYDFDKDIVCYLSYLFYIFPYISIRIFAKYTLNIQYTTYNSYIAQ